MKVCFVTNIYPPNSTGGPAEVVYNLQKYLLDQGVDAYVFTCGNQDKRYPYTIRTYGGKRLFPLISPFRYLKDASKFDFDVINFHLESGMGIAPFLYFVKKPKAITTLHSEHLTESKATRRIVINDSLVFKPSFEELIVKYFLVPAKMFGTYLDIMVSERIIAVSNKTMEDYLKQKRIPKEKITVIHNGVDSEKFSPEISGSFVRKNYGVGDSPLVLTVGSTIILKGIVYAFYALKEILKVFPKVKLMVIGVNAKYREKILPTLCSLGIQNNVVLIDRIPNREMPYYYAASDIVVLPSLSENFPVAGLEAMSSGKPLVASNVGGIPELVTENENGILFEPANVNQMVKALLKLLEKPSLRNNMGSVGRKIVEERFDWKKIGHQYLKEFEKLA